MLTHIGTVAVYVEDQERALEFWTKKMDFELRRNEPLGEDNSQITGTPASTMNWIEVSPEGSETKLVLYPKSLLKNGAAVQSLIVFECRNIAKVFELMRARKVEITGELKKMPWGSFGSFKDPDGNEFIIRE